MVENNPFGSFWITLYPESWQSLPISSTGHLQIDTLYEITDHIDITLLDTTEKYLMKLEQSPITCIIGYNDLSCMQHLSDSIG